jgi:four helix bundle protein
MPVWQKAHNLAIEVFKLTISLPKSEDYGLTSQIRKSSNGAAACISEGFGRNTKKDKSNFILLLEDHHSKLRIICYMVKR